MRTKFKRDVGGGSKIEHDCIILSILIVGFRFELMILILDSVVKLIVVSWQNLFLNNVEILLSLYLVVTHSVD